MGLPPTSPAGFPGWGSLTPFEARVWGYLFLPGKRCLAALAKAEGTSKQSAHNAKARGRAKLVAACAAHGCDFDFLLDAYRRGQKAMANAPCRGESL